MVFVNFHIFTFMWQRRQFSVKNITGPQNACEGKCAASELKECSVCHNILKSQCGRRSCRDEAGGKPVMIQIDLGRKKRKTRRRIIFADDSSDDDFEWSKYYRVHSIRKPRLEWARPELCCSISVVRQVSLDGSVAISIVFWWPFYLLVIIAQNFGHKNNTLDNTCRYWIIVKEKTPDLKAFTRTKYNSQKHFQKIMCLKCLRRNLEIFILASIEEYLNVILWKFHSTNLRITITISIHSLLIYMYSYKPMSD